MILLSYDKSGYRDKSGHRDKTGHRDKRGHHDKRLLGLAYCWAMRISGRCEFLSDVNF